MNGTIAVPRPLYRMLGVFGLLFIGFLGGLVVRFPVRVQAQDRDSRQGREAFLSGGARSERVLLEISEKISTIDGRLAHIEELMTTRDSDQARSDRNDDRFDRETHAGEESLSR